MREICPLVLQFYGPLVEYQTEDAGKVSDQYCAINTQIWVKQQKRMSPLMWDNVLGGSVFLNNGKVEWKFIYFPL